MRYQFENRTEMVQHVGKALKENLREGMFNVEPVKQGKLGSLEIKVTENHPDSKETLTFNFNEPHAGNNGGWECARSSDEDRYNIHLSAGAPLAERANCKMNYTNERDGVYEVEEMMVGVIAEVLELKVHAFFKFAKNRMRNITADDLANYESGGWTAGYDSDGSWCLRKTRNGWDYVLYPCLSDNRFDPPSVNHRWMAGFDHPDCEDDAVGITGLDKAKQVLEWHIVSHL